MYLIDFHRQNEKIRELVTVRKNEETMEVFYHDPSSGEMWKSFFPRGYRDRGSQKLLRPEPDAGTLQERIHSDLITNEESNAMGLAIELSGKPERWAEIISIVNEDRKKYKLGMIRTFLKNLGIYNADEIFDDLDLEPQEVGLDENELQRLKRECIKLRLKRFFYL